MKHGKIILLVVLALAAVTSAADDDALITDRPDFTESAFVVGRGTVQLETGATYTEAGPESETTLPELLIRWGITGAVELRILAPTYAWIDDGSGSSSGFLNAAIGAKIALNEGQGDGFWGRTGAALIVASTVPTGSDSVDSDAWQPSATLSLAWDLSDTIGIGTNVGWTRPEESGDRYDSTYASVAVGVGITDKTSVFSELIWFDRERNRGPDTTTFQAGFTHLINKDLQLDLRAARRLTDEGPDLLVGIGASARF